MSLINKMLQDLDQRHAPQVSAGGHSGGLTQQVRAVRSRRLASDFFWPVMSVLMLTAVGWVAWVAWQIMPHSVVTELALESKPRKPEATKAAQPPATAQPAPTPVASAAPPKSAAAPAARPAGPAKFDMLRLATDMTTPIPGHRVSRKKSGETSHRKSPAPQLLAGGTAEEPGKIDRHLKSTQNERADAEFRRGVNLVNQGRIAEGMDSIRAALQIDPGYETARQTLVALLLESKRMDEAAVVLREGLALNAANGGFAMLLARIMVERNDVKGALALLSAHAAQAGDNNAGYHAFTAALYQRLDRHDEAIEQYQAALRLAPGAGAWWVGLGISYQATDRRKAAAEAFGRAKAAGNLAPPLVAFVDQRLGQLR
jgi:MSHA biogenesis protein MshN